MVTKKKLEADLAAANEALEAEKQKAAAAAKAHDDKVKELSGKVKELEAAATASFAPAAFASATAAAALLGGGAYLRPFRGRAWAMAFTPLRDRCQSLMRGTWRSECSPAATGASIAARRTRMLPGSLPGQCSSRTWPAGQLLLR